MSESIYSKYPIRVCTSTLGCELCGYPILKGNRYHDGGEEHAHVSCASNPRFSLAENQQPEHSDEEMINSLFHRLWTKSVGTIGYDKEQWKQLQKLLEKKGVIT